MAESSYRAMTVNMNAGVTLSISIKLSNSTFCYFLALLRSYSPLRTGQEVPVKSNNVFVCLITGSAMAEGALLRVMVFATLCFRGTHSSNVKFPSSLP